MTASRGRGAPVVFDDHLREKYLGAVASGMRLQDAAAHVRINRNLPTRAARTDHAFAEALQQARALGKKARDEAKAHDESRYNNQGCRCRKCRAAASKARTGRRHTAEDDPGGQVYDLPPAASPPSFPLARAS